ncbi:EAL domain-containing protein [Frankia sp. AiPs1]|uniref:sensor domain-containing phosphodiesterase n=1 Tax=Frankia sp. AiPs1 TaxID=573493 RepID=UPI00255B0519|nr:EAL domain-containing protein [Frankia sp. AiPs1]
MTGIVGGVAGSGGGGVPDPGGVPVPDFAAYVRGLLALPRRQMGMEVAWFDRCGGSGLRADAVEGAPLGREAGFASCAPGSLPRWALVSGRPFLVRDARVDRRTAARAVAASCGAVSCAGVPVVCPGGVPVGLVGCASGQAAPWLGARSLSCLRLVAQMIADCVWAMGAGGRLRVECWQRVSALLDAGGPEIVFQPVYALPGGRLQGAEALARFPVGSGGPGRWFADARLAGLEVELELAAVRNALGSMSRFPAPLVLAVNASPAAVASSRLGDLLAAVPLERLVVEVTEHERVLDYPALLCALGSLRARGLRTAVDDYGAGYAGPAHMLRLRPDFVKMDCSLTAPLGVDVAYLEMARALVRFLEKVGGEVVAEGVETAQQVRYLAAAGVRLMQGFYLAGPGPLPLPPVSARFARR